MIPSLPRENRKNTSVRRCHSDIVHSSKASFFWGRGVRWALWACCFGLKEFVSHIVITTCYNSYQTPQTKQMRLG